MNLITLLLIGDILVCGFLAGLTAWLLTLGNKKYTREVARLPLLSDDETWNAAGVAPEIAISPPSGFPPKTK